MWKTFVVNDSIKDVQMQAFVIICTPQRLAKEAKAFEGIHLQPVATAHFSQSASRNNGQMGRTVR